MEGVETPQAIPPLEQLRIACDMVHTRARRLYRDAAELRAMTAALSRLIEESETQRGRRSA